MPSLGSLEKAAQSRGAATAALCCTFGMMFAEDPTITPPVDVGPYITAGATVLGVVYATGIGVLGWLFDHSQSIAHDQQISVCIEREAGPS